MFVRKTALPSVRDGDKSGGRNVQLGDRRGESSNFSQRGNLLQIHHGGDTLPGSSHGGNHFPSHHRGNSLPRSSHEGNTLLRGSHGRNPLPSPRGGNTFPRSSRGGKTLPRSSREGNTRWNNSDWENTLPRNSGRGKLLPSHHGGNTPPRSSHGGNPLPRSSHDGSPRGGNSFPRSSRGRNLPSSTRKGNSFQRSSHRDDSFPRSFHEDDSFQRSSHRDDSLPRSSHGDGSFQRSSHGDDSFPRSSHGDDSYPRSSRGRNSFPRSSHRGNPRSSTRGGNTFPFPHERNRYGGPEGGRENDRDGEFYQGYQKAEEGPKTYMDFEGRNQDRGSNFSSRWEERNAGASVNQRDYNTSMDPSRGSSPPYMHSVRGSNSRLLDPDRRSTMSFRDMQSQRKRSEPYRGRGRQKDKRGRKRSEPYMNRDKDKRGMRGDFEETTLGILDKVLSRDLQESTTQNYPSYSDELDVDRYARWNQSYEQDHLGMGAQESPSHFKVPGQRNNRGKIRQSIEERIQKFPSSYEVSDLRDIDSDPQPFEAVSMNSGMYPPEVSGFINDMELDLYDSSHQEHFQEVKPNSRKRRRINVGPQDNKKPKSSIMSRLGPKLGVSRNPSGEDSAGNNIRMRDGALYTVKGIVEKSDKRSDDLTPPSNKLDELNRLAQNFHDFPTEALHCKECDIPTFSTVFKFFKHGISEEHLSFKKSFTDVFDATFISLSRHAQLAFAQNIGPWNPKASSMCKMCRVPNELRSGSDHTNVQECWVLHQYTTGGCCTFVKFKGRSGIEIHQSSLEHLQNEYLRNKEREKVDKREREKLRAVKEIFTIESNKDEVGRNFSIKFINTHRSELEVIQGFGKTEVPEEITSLIKTHRVSDTDSMKREIYNPKKFPFQFYRPSVPHFTSQVLFVTDLECIICGTIMGKSKQSVIDHCSTKEHYDNVVKKHERVKKVISLSKEEEEEKKATATGMRENRRGRESEKNVKDRKDKEDTVREAAGKSKWERGGEDEEEDDNEWGDLLSEYDDGDDDDGDAAEEDYYDDDDVRMDNLEDKVEEAVNESNYLKGKKGGGGKRKTKVPITFNLKEYEANKAGTEPSGEKTNDKEEDLTTRKEGEKEKQGEKPARPLQKKKFYF